MHLPGYSGSYVQGEPVLSIYGYMQSGDGECADVEELQSPGPKRGVEAVFKSLMEAPKSEVRKWVGALVQRYKEGSDVKDEEKGVQDLAIILDSQFLGDIGIMCVFVLNVLHLNPGEAVFLKANDPHAYIDGVNVRLEEIGILAQQKAAGISAILSDKAPVTEAMFGVNGFNDGKPANNKQRASQSKSSS
ncbi:hypothetical protein DACRYDRAFT_107029 [Dacryopinax primogenitus]|uniref:Phosphomannose isomerase type I helical insertion domain-containing protein n=1 Tax=Dacryopinax primogenitus (strain DJM 731) TaxID=1858805 RepID=M5G002_DACPD|nr:uncharacterized protein DACRYDRAFT_107029 [Dacryopinax primogenitus]EJU02084.1 hypothetical protein DACRYDRAFT_107029 [Dacryopinax primogenitus]